MRITACLITKNEAKNLARCLKSVEGVVHEIVVVDSGSTDATEEIARSFGSRFIRHAWEGYVGQKNFALALAQNEWVLSLDADEELSAKLRNSILALASKKGHPAGYEVSRMVYFQGSWIRHGDWYPDRLVRLFRKEKGQFVGGDVHERLELEGKSERLSGHLHHFTYTDAEDRLRRIRLYASLWVRGAIIQGRRARPWTPVLRAGWRFFRGYVIKRGYLDGPAGFEVAWGNALEVFLKYQLLRKTDEDPLRRTIRPRGPFRVRPES